MLRIHPRRLLVHKIIPASIKKIKYYRNGEINKEVANFIIPIGIYKHRYTYVINNN